MATKELFILIAFSGSFVFFGVALAIARFEYVRSLRKSAARISAPRSAGRSNTD
jgi:hypothetical protein